MYSITNLLGVISDCFIAAYIQTIFAHLDGEKLWRFDYDALGMAVKENSQQFAIVCE